METAATPRVAAIKEARIILVAASGLSPRLRINCDSCDHWPALRSTGISPARAFGDRAHRLRWPVAQRRLVYGRRGYASLFTLCQPAAELEPAAQSATMQPREASASTLILRPVAREPAKRLHRRPRLSGLDALSRKLGSRRDNRTSRRKSAQLSRFLMAGELEARGYRLKAAGSHSHSHSSSHSIPIPIPNPNSTRTETETEPATETDATSQRQNRPVCPACVSIFSAKQSELVGSSPR